MSAYNINGSVIAEMNPTENPTDIVSLNPEIKEKLVQAKRPLNIPDDGYLTNTQPVTLFWFSDVHADKTELERMIDFKTKYADMLDDTICTGDMVALRASDGMSFWYGTEGSEDILMAVGNHDALAATSGYDWTNLLTEQEQYNRYIAPNVAEWGVQYTSGKTYYYKDYTAKKLRLIVINYMLTGADNDAQLTWLAATLTSARTNGLSVVIASHHMLHGTTVIDCGFTSIDKTPASGVGDIAVANAVQSFINDGGEFICYITGHKHYDVFGKGSSHPDQYWVCIDALSMFYANRYSDTQRTEGTKSQDLANLIVFDTVSKTVKIMRVGADMDHYLRPKHCLSFKYLTGEILCDY